MKMGSNSVDSALDFDTSNRTILNYKGRDLNTSLMAKNTGFLLLKTLKNAGEVSYTSSLNQLLFNQSKVSLQTSGILPI